MKYVICVVIGIIVGFLIGKLQKAKTYHKDVADVLLRCMEMEEEQAHALKCSSMMDHVVKTKGMDYAILHYGNIYHILRGIPKKEEKLEQVEQAIAGFLQEAMRDDLEQYKKEQQAKKDK